MGIGDVYLFIGKQLPVQYEQQATEYQDFDKRVQEFILEKLFHVQRISKIVSFLYK